ncbi:molybdopterin-dependent oxidoreductase [Frigidibacter mobilis]|uniref:Oxidoreductase, molybdopterin-binding n=1 Tax=Frigidibacter mobilis TaxID=1335048 RepID=A0A159Z538_9RHOB|nr:molybdopterin-dependent oxidoreductase [Frigidibacter mobilis]AMY70331.1 oxidoreductase, molybdopterin-binding [Frigidibacter mobilis]
MALTLSHWGRAVPVVRDGRLVAMDMPADDPNPSRISENIVDAVTSPVRIVQPMARKGYLAGDGGAARGEDSFVAVSWDKAVSLLAADLQAIIARHGNEAIFGGSYGWASAGRFHHAQSQIHRFLNLAGGYVRSVNTHSHAAAEVVLPHLIGSQDGMADNQTPWELIVNHTELFVAFGGLPARNAQVSAGGVSRHLVPDQLRAAREAGTQFVNISPLRDDMAPELGADWMAPRPNTDVALMMGLAHVLEVEGLADGAFLDRFTTGYGRFRDALLGRDGGAEKTPEWAAAITGLPAERIRSLARKMAARRTMISCAWSLQRADHGEQAIWMTITLAAMLGQIGLPGGGFGTGYSAANRVGNSPLPFAWPAFPQLRNPVQRFIPVARLGDMLEHPGAEFDYDGARYTYPDIEMIWWAGGNPFHHQQDLRRLHRVWKKPTLVVVQEPFWNGIARHADIVLPCTLSIERNDLGIAKAEPHLIAMKQAVQPPGQTLNDYDILARIAGEMGFGEAFTEGRDEMGWLRDLYDRGVSAAAPHGYNLPDFDSFWQAGEYLFEQRVTPKALMQDFRRDPAAHPLPTPSGRIEIGSDRVAGFGYDDCPGLPTWFEPAEWLGNAPAGGLHLISNQPSRKLHSQLDQGSWSRAGKVMGREPARLHPVEAERRDIREGDVILLRSARGSCLAGAIVSADVAMGVIQMSTGAWLDLDDAGLDRHGNVNVLTLDKPTSRLAQGPTAHTTIVFAERFEGSPPAVRAFEPPVIEEQEKT